MKRSTHPEAYDYVVILEGSTKIVDDMLDKLVIGIWEAHADIRAGKQGLGAMKVEQCDVITENGSDILGPDYYGYVGESYQEAVDNMAAKGIEVIIPSDQFMEDMRNATAPAYEEQYKLLTQEQIDIFEQIRAMR